MEYVLAFRAGCFKLSSLLNVWKSPYAVNLLIAGSQGLELELVQKDCDM